MGANLRVDNMKTVKVTFDNGNEIVTRINGTQKEILEYYKIGNYFNIGSIEDAMHVVMRVEILEPANEH